MPSDTQKLKTNLSRLYNDLNAASYFLKNNQIDFARKYINGVKGDIKTQIKNL